MITRSIESQIKEHFCSSQNALFLTGARQVGKTSVVHKFASENGYKLVEFNFLLKPESTKLFQNLNDVSELLLRILLKNFMRTDGISIISTARNKAKLISCSKRVLK